MKLFSMQFAKVLRVDTIVCAVMLVFSLSGCSLFDDSDGKLQQIGLEEEELRDDEVRHIVFNGGTEEDDPLFEQA